MFVPIWPCECDWEVRSQSHRQMLGCTRMLCWNTWCGRYRESIQEYEVALLLTLPYVEFVFYVTCTIFQSYILPYVRGFQRKKMDVACRQGMLTPLIPSHLGLCSNYWNQSNPNWRGFRSFLGINAVHAIGAEVWYKTSHYQKYNSYVPVSPATIPQLHIGIYFHPARRSLRRV